MSSGWYSPKPIEDWISSTRNPSGSIMYTARPPLFGPIVGVTGGETLATPLAVNSAYRVSRSSTCEGDVRRAGVGVAAVDGLGVDTAVLEQLEEDVGAGNAQDRGVEVDGRIADQLADVRRPRVPGERLLETQDVAVEGDRSLQRPHGETGVMGAGDLTHGCPPG